MIQTKTKQQEIQTKNAKLKKNEISNRHKQNMQKKHKKSRKKQSILKICKKETTKAKQKIRYRRR